MDIEADRLSKQVKLAYEFIEALHGQALALIRDVETQLAQGPEELQCLRPGGYRFAVKAMSLSLERPQPAVADYYAVCFRHFAGRVKNTPLDEEVPPIGFLKVVLHERGLEHPEVRFGVLTDIARPADSRWRKVEDMVNAVARKALEGPAWFGREIVGELYQDSYIRFAIRGTGVRLADLPDSEAIAERIVDPLLKMYREAKGQS